MNQSQSEVPEIRLGSDTDQLYFKPLRKWSNGEWIEIFTTSAPMDLRDQGKDKATCKIAIIVKQLVSSFFFIFTKIREPEFVRKVFTMWSNTHEEPIGKQHKSCSRAQSIPYQTTEMAATVKWRPPLDMLGKENQLKEIWQLENFSGE